MNEMEKKEEEEKEEKEEQEEQDFSYVIVPLLIPGSGKTTLCEYIEANHAEENITVVSSDKIRKNIM